jgi:formamidopyrimidine-DNA glycosylase
MPELPEVQTVVDNLNTLEIIGRCFTGAEVYWAKSIAGLSPEVFINAIKDRTIRQITRRGKYVVMRLSNGLTLLIHLRMTGRLNWEPAGSARNKHEHVILQLNGKHELRFQDARKFGRILLTTSPEKVLDKLGPEPLADDFTLHRFRTMLQNRKRAVKPLLLDQKFIAGLGNIYVDEALWKSEIHPQRAACALTRKEVIALHRAIPHVLNKGLRNMGTTLGGGEGNFYSVEGRRGRNADELNVFRRAGCSCPRCGTVIERIIVAQRSSHICPKCQRILHGTIARTKIKL